MAKTCEKCNLESAGMFSDHHESTYAKIKGHTFCKTCAGKIYNSEILPIPVTTTNSIDGCKIIEYLSIESVEIVIGTGVFSEFYGDIADFFGERSTGFEMRMHSAKDVALARLRTIAYEKGGDAVVGVDLDYTEFSSNRIGVVANGTVVKLE